jgi:protein arginine kinase activator
MVNGEVTEHNLCLECAKELDFGGPRYAALFDGGSQLGKLLSGILGLTDDFINSKDAESSKVTCPTCHTTYEEFVKESRFGCPDCYEMFELLMDDQIKTIQGSNTHVGKKPLENSEKEEAVSEKEKEPDIATQIEILNSRLKEAIEEEEYEMAATYRDQIKSLKEKERVAKDE